MAHAQAGGISTFNKIPWMLTIILYLIGAEYLQISMEGTAGYIFIGLAVAVLFLEVFKSGDVGTAAFLLDQFWAVLQVILATGLLSYLFWVEGKDPSFYHWIGFVILIADALLNPFNAYRTAMRNFDVPG